MLGLLIAADAGAKSFPGRVPNDQEVPSLAPMLQQVTPAVVGIATSTTAQVQNALTEDPFLRRFFDLPTDDPATRETRAAGSGVVVDARRGYVVTNHML